MCLILLAPLGASAQDPAPTPSPKPAASPAAPEKPVQLRYDFEHLAGHVATYRIQTTIRQSKQVVGRDEIERGKGGPKGRERGEGEADSTTRQTYELRFERGERGLGTVHMTPRRIEASLEENGRVAYRFDSDEGREAPAGLRAMTENLGKTAVLSVTPRGEVKNVRGVKVSERKAYKANFHELPERALTLGKGWETKDKQPIPPFGYLNYFTSFRLEACEPGPEGRGTRYRIGAKMVITYEGVAPTQDSRLELTGQEGTGQLVFDERGLLVEEKLKSKVVLKISGTAGSEVHTVESETVRWLSALR